MTVTLKLNSGSADRTVGRQLREISSLVWNSGRIVVITGAGVSCSAGIPDFRSSDGLYALVKERYPTGVVKGCDLFDAALFRNPTTTAMFFTFVSQLKKAIDVASPTPTHRFLARLHTKGKLLRLYTQNIDGLEERAGLSATRTTSVGQKADTNPITVQLHGDIGRVHCILCSTDIAFNEEHMEVFSAGQAPPCPDCTQRSQARTARSARAIKIGILRPGIVLYNEPHPLGDHIARIEASDLRKKPDLVIVMGTTLKVHGLKRLVKDFAKAVHAQTGDAKRRVIYVNRTPPSEEWAGIIDYHVQGDTDAWVSLVEHDWARGKPSDWEIQTQLDKGRIMPAIGVMKQRHRKYLKQDAASQGVEQENIAPATPVTTLLGHSLDQWDVQSRSKRRRDDSPSNSSQDDGRGKREKLGVETNGVFGNNHNRIPTNT